MAGGSNAAVVACLKCVGRAVRTYEGMETDSYECAECLYKFSIDWSHGGPPKKPCWPLSEEEEKQARRIIELMEERSRAKTPDLRYRHFTFPYAVVYNELEKLVGGSPEIRADPSQQAPHERLIAWLRENSQGASAVLDLPDWLSVRSLGDLVTSGIENGVGSVSCSECRQTWPLCSIQREQWEQIDSHDETGVMAVATGRRFRCPQGHEIFRTEDSFGCI
jgi:hypothetical protein